MREKICAGIVLYNPEIKQLEKNIHSIIHQIDYLYLYDNFSSNYVEIKSLLEQYDNVYYDRNDANLGIAYGLNAIVNYADKNGYKWILTLDQDSVCSPNMIEVYRKYMNEKNAAIICPFILNNNKYSLHKYRELRIPNTEIINKPIDCITSASLCKVSAIQKAGGFPNDYFIDYVDTDLNCRVLLNGDRIIRANQAYLIQKMGNGRKIQLFVKLYKFTKIDLFRRMSFASVYGDNRLYYEARNSYIVYHKYPNAGFRLNPFFMFLLFSYFTFTYPLKRSRISMWKNIIKGYKAGKKYNKNKENPYIF